MNSLETQLHYWQPRRPSAGLKRRLFAEPVRLMPKMAWFVGWLVPATACALLTFSVFTSGNNLPGRSSRGAALSGNWSGLTHAPEDFGRGENILLSVTFDLTNRSSSTSTASAVQGTRTN